MAAQPEVVNPRGHIPGQRVVLLGRGPSGEPVEASFDDDGHLLVGGMTFDVGDIAIGGVELKDGATDTRAKIGAGSGLVTGDNAVAVSDPTSLGVAVAGQALESGSGQLGWLASIRKAITDRLGTLGQKSMAASTPVTIASDQTAISIEGTIEGQVYDSSATPGAAGDPSIPNTQPNGDLRAMPANSSGQELFTEAHAGFVNNRSLTAASDVVTAVDTVADGADVTQGALADAVWDGSAASATAQKYRRYIGVKIELVRALLAAALTVVGNVAHDAVDSGNPMKIGGRARTTNRTNVADGDRTDLATDPQGRAIVLIGNPRELRGSQAATITGTGETTIVTATASVFHDLRGILIANGSTTDVDVAIKDATSGTTIMTFSAKAGQTSGAMFVQSVPQTTVNNNWTATLSTTPSGGQAHVIITAFYDTNV
jgi:hypothetical protein